ncbi:uncharacterized protein LOC130940794 [Arachis stenosperma]|uniref:uncharacterized protein LOC130940794 n=1 Tax=Arachis stenosperma TaxID=217475 RepID=UPI0025AB6C6E|nr:uncharacterized protein LOC130940794 [Arachis stenosperma]
MPQNLEGIKGGGGSIKLGTTGTIGSLMTRELNQISSTPHKQVPSRTKHRTLPVSVACSSATPKRLQPRKSSDEASSSGGSKSTNTNHRFPSKAVQKTKSSGRSTHRIPILGYDNFPVDRSPAREKNDKKIPNIVEVVDIRCGNADKAWATPLASRLKKLGFSKLSESII